MAVISMILFGLFRAALLGFLLFSTEAAAVLVLSTAGTASCWFLECKILFSIEVALVLIMSTAALLHAHCFQLHSDGSWKV